MPSQRDVMRALVVRFGWNEARVIKEYADMERRGEVMRISNDDQMTPEQYARIMWNDGVRKGWLRRS